MKLARDVAGDEHYEAIARYLEPILLGTVLDKPVLRQIPPEALRAVWPLVEPKLIELVGRSRGRWTVDGMVEKFIGSKWQLWIVWDGRVRAIVGTELFSELSGMKLATIRFCTGTNSEDWVHLIAEIEAWAKDNGCEQMDTIARKGWARKLTDWKMTHVVLEKELT